MRCGPQGRWSMDIERKIRIMRAINLADKLSIDLEVLGLYCAGTIDEIRDQLKLEKIKNDLLQA